MNLTTKESNDTISSLDLYVIVNQARETLGEAKVRLNQFNERIEDELDGDDYKKIVVKNPNATTSFEYLLTVEQAMLVGMRESKAVRRAVLDKLKELQANKFHIPQTYSEALQLCADQAKQLELAAPKVAFVDNLVDRSNLMNASQVAQKHKKSAVWLNKFLDDVGVYSKAIKRGRVFQQWFIDKGLGEMKQTELGYSQALFTNAGEVWINEKLFSEGVI